jgi:hypothetical protein
MKLSTLLFLLSLIFVLGKEEEFHEHTPTHELGKGIHFHEEESSATDMTKNLFGSEERYMAIMRKFDFHKKNTLTKDDLRQILASLFGLDKCECHMNAFSDFFRNYSKNFPDSIRIEDVTNRLTISDFVQALKDYFKDKPDLLKILDKGYRSNSGWIKSIHHMFSPHQHTSFWNSDLFKSIDKNLGLTGKTSLMKEDVRNFLSSLIGDEIVKGEYSDKFKMVFETFLNELPDKITLEDLKMMCLHTKFIGPLIKAFVGEPTIWEKLKYSFKNNWNDFSTGLGSIFKKEESYFDTPAFKLILSALGLEHKDELSKDDIKSLLTYIIGEDIVRGKHSDIFNAIFDTYTKDLPDSVKMSDLKVFLYQHNLPRTVMKFFGKEPTIMEKLKYDVEISWMNMSKYFKSVFVKEESFWDSPEFKAVINKLGWAEDQSLRKDDIKHLMINMIGEDNISNENKGFFENVFDLFLKDFPDEIKINDLRNYMDQNKFMKVVKSYFHREPTTYEKMKTFMWDNMGQYFSKLFSKKEENFWTSSIYNEIASSLWKNKEYLNREDVINFFNRFLEGKIPVKYKQDMNEIYNKYLKDLPDRINIKEVSNYLDIKRFFSSFRDYFTIKYSDTLKDRFSNLTEATWYNLNDQFERVFQSASSFWNESLLPSSLKYLGYTHKNKLNREEMYELIRKLIFGKDTSIPEVIDDVIRAYIRQLPDNVPVQDIPDYMDYFKFINAIKEVGMKKYGKSHMLNYQPLFDSMKMNLSDVLYDVFNYTLKHEEL